jgi:serine/threonine-protein kinase
MDLLAQVRSALGQRYVVDREVGRGGMAVVFLAHDTKHGRRVAVKVLRPEIAGAIGADRFVREIEIAARLTHPHILPLHDSGHVGDLLYYVMPYVEGESLRHLLEREKQLALNDALRTIFEIADAVGHAHGLGIVHRDLKPENVLLEAGHAVLSDFGIARAITAAGGASLTETGIALGTPAYMSPEQSMGEGPVDARSDVYALGCLMYELLAGKPPFTGATALAILARKSVGDIPPLSVVRRVVPPEVERVIHRALAAVPADRFATAKEFGDALRAASQPRTADSRRWIAWLAAGVAALAIGGVSVGMWARRAPPAQHTLAVLYFENLSADTLDAYLADGLTEEISSRLADVGRLQVKSRSAVRRFRGTPVSDPSGAAQALGVRYLVEGSVRRAGERVRASVQLVEARSGFRVWGEDYDRASHDLLSLQEDIARQVAVQIAGRLLPAEHVALATRPTNHPAAYDHFLRGNYYLTQRTPDAVRRAIAEYERSVDLDAAFTAALARAAYAYALYLEWGWAYPGLPPDSLLARGFAAADRALATDSTASDAWMGRAYMLVHRHPKTLDGVLMTFERALALDRGNAEAWHQYGWMLYVSGEDSAAAAAYHEALRIEPQRPFTLVQLASIDFYKGRHAAAMPWLDSALVIDPAFGFGYAVRALARLQTGDVAGARADAGAARRHTEPVYAEAAFAMVQARLGDTLGARARIAGLTSSALRRETLPVEESVFLAGALAATGDRDRALRVLERARPRGAHLFSDLQWSHLDSLRRDPRFQRLATESRPATQ